ncbi:1-phosphofructokinase family hexose kinase [Roseomonas marmotae]|uniref:Phosphofructokinase n=1 Tax=Roseomonas marmotae TaxID=2768161 RepID=A0ABS3KB28_9PROT|nr:1-phosphofructokinase family hexose kinase [Roseomonas marmotae]MBO1074683.1 1-phosphofructokinase family hexose kinase [Roseomonas marmotae]QTI81701.1 1-phosphofructokinase family hexose kinase [Roseomonas marmotae]
MSSRITTLTLNPTIDVASEAAAVHPVRKVRTFNERQDPGGGGVNVSRVVQELGGETLAIILAGGVTGRLLEELLDSAGVPRRSIPIAGRTRISQTVLDRASGQEYRFVPEGPAVSGAEWGAALEAIGEIGEGWLVASGSLPTGVPGDFYARTAVIARERGLHLVVDTSGEALRLALEQGGIELMKPSRGEFESLVGRPLRGDGELEQAATELVRSGRVARLAVTLGGDGAVLATAEGALRLPALDVPVRGAVGAGDSFLAAMTLALSRGATAADAFAWGVAAGAAAVSNAGTAHPSGAEVEALRRRITEIPVGLVLGEGR